MEINQAWVDEQRAICEAATPGRWVAVEKGNSVPFVAIVRCATGEEPITIASSISPKRRDYEFIVAAHENYPAALTEIERLAADNRKLREAHELAQSGYGTYAHTGNENTMQQECARGAGEETK